MNFSKFRKGKNMKISNWQFLYQAARVFKGPGSFSGESHQNINTYGHIRDHLDCVVNEVCAG
jgi:hypothetical protein